MGIHQVQDAAGNQTTFSYDPATGRKSRECNALGKCSYFSYDARGQLLRTWGDVPYPVEYVYDDLSRRTEMHTFRADLGWTTPDWPDGSSIAADPTFWEYEAATGLLLAKRDAAGKAVTYTYEAAGRLKTRTWARQRSGGGPLVTTYGYDDTTGELLSVSYNDSTPGVTYAYDRLGRQQTISDGTGVRTFSYDANTLDLTTETLTGLTPAIITHKHSTTGLLGRPTGLKLGTTYDVTYDYDQRGRFETLSWNIDGTQDSATYTRVDDSDLLAGYTTASGMSVGYGYEVGRDLKTQVSNRWNGSVVSQYDYRYDAIGRRTSVENSGSAFGPTEFTSWGYDERNQVTASNRYTGSFTASPSPANEVADERRGFEYDPIGNRESALDQDGVTSISYTPNELNQYEAVGSASPIYDDDGNLLDDGTKVLAYNAENQLKSVTVPGVSVSTYDYDYIGRRVRKSVDLVSGDDYSVSWVYSGWNKLEERKTVGSTTTVKNFVWGLDLSQSMEGAGGIGGLVAVVDGSGNGSLFSYDGNGNVSELVAASTGTTVAHYEYDAFGNVLVATGTAAADNAYRFSTKYADDETGLVYYGYRFYDAEVGRWVNRDPIGEAGGFNLYAFGVNRATDAVDPYGDDASVAQHFIRSKRRIVRRIHVGMLVVPGDCKSADGTKSSIGEAEVAAAEIAAALRSAYPSFEIHERLGTYHYEFFFEVKATRIATPVFRTGSVLDAYPGKNARSVASAYREAKELGLENLVIVHNSLGGLAFSPRFDGEKTTSGPVGNVSIVRRTETGQGSVGQTMAHETVHLLGIGDRYSVAVPGGLFEENAPNRTMSRSSTVRGEDEPGVGATQEQQLLHRAIDARPEGIAFPPSWQTGGTEGPYIPATAP